MPGAFSRFRFYECMMKLSPAFDHREKVRGGETGNRSRGWPGPPETGREAGLGHRKPVDLLTQVLGVFVLSNYRSRRTRAMKNAVASFRSRSPISSSPECRKIQDMMQLWKSFGGGSLTRQVLPRNRSHYGGGGSVMPQSVVRSMSPEPSAMHMLVPPGPQSLSRASLPTPGTVKLVPLGLVTIV
jgi:hypothetical protein